MRFTDNDDGAFRLVSEQDNLADLASRVRPDDRTLYDSFGHIYQEAAFFNRRFVVVQTKGKATGGGPRPPVVLGAIRVVGFAATHDGGCTSVLMDEGSSRTLQIGHVPVKLFRYPVFVSIPVFQGVRWEAKEAPDGSYTRSLVFGMCFKQQSAIKWFNKDNVSVVTHNEFQRLFGGRARSE